MSGYKRDIRTYIGSSVHLATSSFTCAIVSESVRVKECEYKYATASAIPGIYYECNTATVAASASARLYAKSKVAPHAVHHLRNQAGGVADNPAASSLCGCLQEH